MSKKTLQQWLDWIKNSSTKEIDLGLDRVKALAYRLNIFSHTAKVITVAGTNGKGSTVAVLEALYGEAGFKVGAYTSPFLIQYSEQIRLNGQPVCESLICEAFEAIESERFDLELTIFEWGTLAGLYIFKNQWVDVMVLEVGLGGRLDAVNIMDADVAVVTTIDLDHMEYLGNTRDAIALEKAGVFRSGRPAVCGDQNVPTSLRRYAKQLGTPLFCLNEAFEYHELESTWVWECGFKKLEALPLPNLFLQNVSSALMAAFLLQEELVFTDKHLHTVLKNICLPGRLQIIPGDKTVILDVAHNPAGIQLLNSFLKKNPNLGKTFGVFSMLSDKDITESIRMVTESIDIWHAGVLETERGASKNLLEQGFLKNSVDHVFYHDTVNLAFQRAIKDALVGDRVVVFGSFYTVGCIMKTLSV